MALGAGGPARTPLARARRRRAIGQAPPCEGETAEEARLCSENPAPGFGSRSGYGLEGDAITLALQRLNGSPADAVGVAAVVVVGARVLVGVWRARRWYAVTRMAWATATIAFLCPGAGLGDSVRRRPRWGSGDSRRGRLRSRRCGASGCHGESGRSGACPRARGCRGRGRPS
jgi:hypothetical protein